ncbi:MAG: DUF3187 family protein [Thermoanaerobaculia bacterium]
MAPVRTDAGEVGARAGTAVCALLLAILVSAGVSANAQMPDAAGAVAVDAAPASSEEPWQTLGLLRIRDLTLFGINRLDMLPAHAVPATPGTFAIEVSLGYQNTWSVSGNVRDYLAERGIERGEIGDAEIAEIFALPGESYLVDGELGVADLTLHYRIARHLGVYTTIPYYHFGTDFLDSTIEGFHNGIGISNAGRNYVPKDRFLALVHLDAGSLVLREPPDDDFGDPVFGVRYSLTDGTGPANIVVEAAYKWSWSDRARLVSTGSDDFGLEVSFQRKFRRNALYLSLAGVYLGGLEPLIGNNRWIPTVVAGWETRLSRRFNFIIQSYFSESVVQETSLDELSADKFQVTAGLQWIYRGAVLRFGITENVENFDNTPDIGITLSAAKVVFGRR